MKKARKEISKRPGRKEGRRPGRKEKAECQEGKKVGGQGKERKQKESGRKKESMPEKKKAGGQAGKKEEEPGRKEGSPLGKRRQEARKERRQEEEENCFYPGKTIKLVWLAIYSAPVVPWFLPPAILLQTVSLCSWYLRPSYTKGTAVKIFDILIAYGITLKLFCEILLRGVQTGS